MHVTTTCFSGKGQVKGFFELSKFNYKIIENQSKMQGKHAYDIIGTALACIGSIQIKSTSTLEILKVSFENDTINAKIHVQVGHIRQT